MLVIRSRLRWLLLALVVGLAAGCAQQATPSDGSGVGPIETAEAAVARVQVVEPALARIGPFEPDAIGQAHWWEARPAPNGWQVTFRIGWGDCPAGCISEHQFLYEVSTDGSVALIGEGGEPIPPEVINQLGGGDELPGVDPGAGGGDAGTGGGSTDVSGVVGRAVSGPTCPVAQPNDPTCDPAPVPGAILVIRAADGAEVGATETDANGQFVLELPPGDYVLEPQPVEGILGTPASIPFRVTPDERPFLDVTYDTGIR